MITTAAQRSIEAIFEQAARTRLTPASGESCAIVAVDPTQRDETLAPRAIVLTITSLVFRLLFALHFRDDDATRACFMSDDGERTLPEVLTEMANLCCGFVNQQMVAHFPDLGMSTPYELDSRCVAYLDELKPDHVWAYDVRVGDTAHLGVTLCVCSKAPVDFVATVAEEAQDEGELELF